MAIHDVRAVVFDVGNTLWFEANPDVPAIGRKQAERLKPLIAGWGVTLAEPIEQGIGDVWSAYLEAFAVERDRRTLREPSLPFLIRGALAARDIDITPAQAEAWVRTSWISEIEFGVQLYPDTLDVLRELKELGLLVGINTNRPCTADMHRQGLRDTGIAPYVDTAVCSGDTGYFKPHSSTFELVIDTLGVAPHEAVMVGDNADADMHGGKATGMRTVWKLNGRYDLPPCTEADFAIHDLAELLSLPLFRRRARPWISAESLTPHDDGNAERY